MNAPRCLALLLAVLVASSSVRAAAPPRTDPPPAARWAPDNAAEAQLFEGDRFVALPSPPDLRTGPFTVTAWVLANDLAGGNSVYGRGIARQNNNDRVGDWVLSVQPDGRVRFCNWRKAGDDTTGCHVTKAAMKVGAWQHVAAVWDGKVTRLFINGVESACTTTATAAGWGTGSEVGRGWTAGDYFWDGRIAGVRVYKRAVEAGEIAHAAKVPPRVQTAATAGPSGDAKVSAAVDRQLEAKLQEKKVRPVGTADDATFHRRLMLDLSGRIPTRLETEAFLADSTPDKRSRLIDELLAGKEFPLYWAQVLANWLMPPTGRRDPLFVAYLRNSLMRNRKWDQLASDVFLGRQGGASSFLGHRAAALKDHSIARDVGEAFFGVNLRCAQCHDHPTVKEWTRERFYGLSAFFVRTQASRGNGQPTGMTFEERPTGELEYVHEGKKKLAPPTFLDGRVAVEPRGNSGPYSRREALLKMALDDKSRLFAKAIVNRVWRKLMGRGLVEPVDLMHAGNPPTHPELLDLLADDFARNGYDLRRLIAVIVNSQAYGRSSRWTGDGDAPDERLYATAVLRPLDADQLAISLPLATGYYDAQVEGKGRKNLASIRQTTAWYEVVKRFDAPGDDFEPTAEQALFLLNSDHVQTNFLANSNLSKALVASKDDEALARRAYLTILSRPPTSQDVARVSRYLQKRGEKARAEACREVIWALISGAEFRFQH